jgi:DNA-binding SARP family transcriptional activator
MLGSFEVRTDDGAFAGVPGARLRGLLIALALEPGRVVPKATLVDWIWGEHPPAGATNALHRLVSGGGRRCRRDRSRGRRTATG